MNTQPVKKLIETTVGFKNRWQFKSFACRLEANATGVIVKMKAGNRYAGEPGEEFEFSYACKSLDEALDFVKNLPDRFGPKDCKKLGFTQTSWGIYD